MTSPGNTPTLDRQDDQVRLRHDMRQALSAMSAVLGVIQADPLRAATVLPRLHQLRTEAEWLTAILGDETGQARPCDISDIVSDAWTAEGRYALCTVQLRREHVPLVLVDAAGARRAVRNLLNNAIRAAGPTGHVQIAVWGTADRVVVEIADDGPGFGNIPVQSGLGMPTARDFARDARGSISVAETAGGGTSIRLELPALDSLSVPDLTRDSA